MARSVASEPEAAVIARDPAPFDGSWRIEPLDRPTTLARARELSRELEDRYDEFDSLRRVPTDVVRRLKAAGLFRMTMPVDWGGSELDPVTQLEVIEEVSRANPSVGWILMIGIDSGYYSAWIDQDDARAIWTDADMTTAGQLNPRGSSPGKVAKVPGGFEISGRFSFGSGICHADVIIGGCYVPTGTREPEWRIMVFDPKDVTVFDSWSTLGMRATGSHDYEVIDAYVPDQRSFVISGSPVRRGPLYSSRQSLLTKMGAVGLGIGRAAIDEARRYVLEAADRGLQDSNDVQVRLARAEAALGGARAYVLSSVRSGWETRCQGGTETSRQLAEQSIAATAVWPAARQIVRDMGDLCGTRSIRSGCRLERLYRDVTTAGQHVTAQEKSLIPGARRLLGLPSGHLIY